MMKNMPVDDYGNRIDILLNPLGVNNRLNYSQLYEHELNHLTEAGNSRCKGFSNRGRETKSISGVDP